MELIIGYTSMIESPCKLSMVKQRLEGIYVVIAAAKAKPLPQRT